MHNVERLGRDEVVLHLPRNEFDGVRKLNGRTRVQRRANAVGGNFGRGIVLWGDVDAELRASRYGYVDERTKGMVRTWSKT